MNKVLFTKAQMDFYHDLTFLSQQSLYFHWTKEQEERAYKRCLKIYKNRLSLKKKNEE